MYGTNKLYKLVTYTLLELEEKMMGNKSTIQIKRLICEDVIIEC